MSLIIEAPSKRSCQSWSALLFAQVAIFAAVGIYCVWMQRYLYGDGSYLFIRMLKYQQVNGLNSAHYFARVLIEYPAIFLIQVAGLRNVATIGATYGATAYLLPLVGLLLTWWAVRRSDGVSLAIPLIAYSIIYLDVSGVIYSEGIITASLFWPVLYLLKFSERLTMIRSLVLIVLAMLITRTSEYFVVLVWPLLFVAVERGIKGLRQRTSVEYLTCGACTVLFAIGSMISAQSLLPTSEDASESSILLSTFLHLLYPPVWFSLLLLADALLCLFSPNHERMRQRISFVLIACAIVIVLSPLVGFVAPSFQYFSQVQLAYVPLILSSVILFPGMMNFLRQDGSAPQRSELWRLTIIACAVAAAFQTTSTFRWDRYRTALLNDLAENHGLIAYERSRVAVPEIARFAESGAASQLWRQFKADPRLFLGRMTLCQFDWGWATPSLCVALSSTNVGSIRTIICVPANTEWQPFDPHKYELIPDLSAYGITNELEDSSIAGR